MKVIKRDGSVEEFDIDKIRKAVRAAYESQECEMPDDIISELDYIFVLGEDKSPINVETIQDKVEKILMEVAPHKVAKAYIMYRESHSQARFIRERLDYMDKYATSSDNAATSSETDANANVSMKNVANLEGEVYKTTNRIIQRQRMKDKLNELFPEVAKQYEKDLNDHIIYVHDEASSPTLKYYCCAVSLYPLMTDGVGNIDGITPTPPNDIQSFSGQITNLAFLLSSQCKGACMYYKQELFIKEQGFWKKTTVAELFQKYSSNKEVFAFNNFQGSWEYIDVSDKDIFVLEDNREVKVNKLYRREYSSDIYKISTLDGYIAKVSKDHIFKRLVLGREVETKAKDLKAGDTVFITKERTSIKQFNTKDWKTGWCIGLLCGDGCLTKPDCVVLAINYAQEYLGDTFNSYSSEVFGEALHKNKGHHCWNYQKRSPELYNKVKEFIIGDTTYDKHIDISKYSMDFLLGFLDGLICADGSLTATKGVSISLTNYELSKNIYDIVTKLDISYKGIHSLPQKGNRKESWYQYIPVRILKYLNISLQKIIPKNNAITYSENNARENYYYGKDAFQSRQGSNARRLWSSNKDRVKLKTDVIDGIETFQNDSSYVYEIETESHWYNCGGFLTHNCAFGDYFIALNYYVVKEFGPKWYEKVNEVVTNEYYIEKHTMAYYIRKGMKQFIYGVNQPAGNRSYNSPFTNVSYYDKYYFKSLFENFKYPDGTEPEWKAIDTLQRMFMQLHRELRLIKPLTFPVSTMALVYDDQDYLDKEYKELCAEEWAKGGSFFLYSNNNPTSLASCCFSGDTKFLWKSSTTGVHIDTFKDFLSLPYKQMKENFKVFHNGSWVKGKVISLPNKPMYKVTTYNNKEFIMSNNHISLTYEGEKKTEDLTIEDYLMFNTSVLSPIAENDEHLTYEQGLLIGLFLGDGTFGNYICLDGSVHNFQLSLNKEKWEKVQSYLSKIGDFRLGTIHNNVYPIHCYDKELTTFIAKWTGNEPNKTSSLNKSLNMDCFLQSVEFRKGILEGWYITDGGNSNRCYTISKQLVERMEALCTTLGLQTIVDISDRTDEAVVIRGQEYNRNYPLYCLRWYTEANHRCNKTKDKSWKKKNNSVYWKIKSIEPVEYKDNIYCIQCDNQDEPYFTLPCGLITHNCRVLNEITDNTFSSTTGMAGIMTGSCNVITLNINRIVQDWYRTLPNGYVYGNYQGLKDYIKTILERVYKYHIAFKTMLYDLEDKGMFAASNGGYIYMRKLYSTIGIIGYFEAAKFLGITPNNNEEYKHFLQAILSVVKEENAVHSIKDKKRPILFNFEAVPKLTGHSKPLLIDLKLLVIGQQGASRGICAA